MCAVFCCAATVKHEICAITNLRTTCIRLLILRSEDALPVFEILYYAEAVEERQHNIGDYAGPILDPLPRCFYQQSREFLLSARNNSCAWAGKPASSRIEFTEKHPRRLSSHPKASLRNFSMLPNRAAVLSGYARHELEVALKAGKKEILLIFELRIQARLVDAGRLFQVLHCRVREAVFQKDRDGPVQHTLAIELFSVVPCFLNNNRRIDEPNGS